MRRLLRDISVFLVLGLIVGEVIARLFALTSDIPNRVIDEIEQI